MELILIQVFIATIISYSLITTFLFQYFSKNKPDTIMQIEDEKLKQKKLMEYVNLYNSLINAVIGTFICFIAQQKYGLDLGYDSNAHMIEKAIIVIIFSYFIFDTVLGFIFNFNQGLMGFHHVAAIMILFYSIIRDRFYQSLLWCFYIGEFSGIFLQLYSILEFHSKFKKLHKLFGVIFCLLFLYLRGPYLYRMNRAIQMTDVTMVVKLFAGVFCNLKSIFKLGLVLASFKQVNKRFE